MKTNSDSLIVSFHIGRGGRFNNAGYKTFIGEKNFQDLLSLENNNIFLKDRDDKGRFCKPFAADGNGNLISDDDINSLTGTLDFDGQYDTSYAKLIDDCDDYEFEMMTEALCYKSPKLVSYLKSKFPALDFDDYGILQDKTTEED